MRSVLIADGNQSVATLFASVFRQSGWTVTLFVEGPPAVEALKEKAHYDLVLVSYELGGMNGAEFTRNVRSLGHRRLTPMLMVTGSRGVDAEVLAAGVDQVLHKPVDIYALLAAAARCVERAGRQDSTPNDEPCSGCRSTAS